MKRLLAISLVLTLFACCGKEKNGGEIDLGTNKKTVIENFEGTSYRSWTKEGNAFSWTLPSSSDLANWGMVGYEGDKVMTSLAAGDAATGKLTSPAFTIDRPWFNFLVCGGGDIDNLYVALLIDGKEFRREAGLNNWVMEQVAWDVSAYVGKSGQIVIGDDTGHAWGFIAADYFYLSEKPATTRKSKKITVTDSYLNFPVSYKDNVENIRIYDGENVIADLDIRLTDGTPDYWASIPIKKWMGKELEVAVIFNTYINAETPLVYSNGLQSITQSAAPADEYSSAPERPRVHFSAARGWLNDPNGLFQMNGVYHMSFQHNPVGVEWNNMHWGHAWSRDLVHWTQTDDVLAPDDMGAPFSGHAAVIGDKVYVIYTAAGENWYGSRDKLYSQCMAISEDGGYTWKRYQNNPVIGFVTTNARDPQIAWSDEDGKWVLVLYLYDDLYAFFESSDLFSWTETSRINIPGEYECPDFVKYKVPETGENLWVLSGVKCNYYVGHFSGGVFTPISDERQKLDAFERYNAAHVFANVAGDRKIQVACLGNGHFKGMPFNQVISFPKELSLHYRDGKYKLWAKAVPEIENLYIGTNSIKETNLALDGSTERKLDGCAFHLKGVFDVAQTTASSFGFQAGEIKVTFDKAAGSLSVSGSALDKTYGANGITPVDGMIELEVIIDNGVVDVFAGSGQASVTAAFDAAGSSRQVKTIVNGGTAMAKSLVMAELSPFWE